MLGGIFWIPGELGDTGVGPHRLGAGPVSL
jgi:hypothetical protein